MTLPAYLDCIEDVAAATARLMEALTVADSPDEVELFASRLKKACDLLSKAVCKDASRQDMWEASRVLAAGRRLAFAVKVTSSSDGEFPKLYAAG
jgi:hypothetical protein